MATLFLLMILAGIVGCVALIRWSEGPPKDKVPTKMTQTGTLGNFKYLGD